MQLWFYNESHACFSTELFIIWVPETVRFFTGDFFFFAKDLICLLKEKLVIQEYNSRFIN